MDVKAALLYRSLRPVDYTALLAAVNSWMNAEDMVLRHSPSGGETHILFSNPNFHAILSLHHQKIDEDVLAHALQAPTLGFKNFDYDDAIAAHKMHVAITVGDGPMHVTPEIRAWMGRMGRHQEVPTFPTERKLIALNAIVQQFVAHDVPELVYWAQSDMIYSPEEITEAADMLFPLPLVVRPVPIDGGIDINGMQTVGVRLDGSERFVGRTMIMEPSVLPFAESMGFVMWLTSQRIEGRLTLEHGAGLETPGFPTLYLRHEMPDALDPQGRIVVTQQKPDVYAVTAAYPGMTTLLASHQPTVQTPPATVMQPAPSMAPLTQVPMMQPEMPQVASHPVPPMPAPEPVQPAPSPFPRVAAQPMPAPAPAPAPAPMPMPAPAAMAPQPAPAPTAPQPAPQPMVANTVVPAASLPRAAEIGQPEAPMGNPFAEAIAAAARESERENVVPLADTPADLAQAPASAAPVGWANAAPSSGPAPKTSDASVLPLAGQQPPMVQIDNNPSQQAVDVAQALMAATPQAAAPAPAPAEAPAPAKKPRRSRLSLLPMRAATGMVAIALAVAAGLLLAPQFQSSGLDMAQSSPPSMSVIMAPQLPGQN